MDENLQNTRRRTAPGSASEHASEDPPGHPAPGRKDPDRPDPPDRSAAPEKPGLRIKPPARDFRPLVPKDSGTWSFECRSLEGGYLRLCALRSAEGPVHDPMRRIPKSWAVVDRPAEADSAGVNRPAGSAGPACPGGDDAGTDGGDKLPPWTWSDEGMLEFGEIRVRRWMEHPEAVRFSVEIGAESSVYGLGERMGRLERSGRMWDMWNTDEPEHLPSRDPLYVSVPFAIIGASAGWYGLFVDVPGRQYWDTGFSEGGTIRVDVEDEYVDAYLFTAPNPRELLAKYTRLTGSQPLPPRWALGFHQSRYSYFPEDRVEELACSFREHGLPADVIHLDIDYMESYKIFTWNGKRFPDPAELARKLEARGFRLITIVDPGIKIEDGYHMYDEGTEKGYFCRLPDGRVYEGAVWPGPAVYPDFSREEVRRWWAEKHEHLLGRGIDGIWNDMNEPADFTGDELHRPDFTVPNRLVAENDGEPVDFRRFHNLYANGMNIATREAFRTKRPEDRGFVLSRSGYAGVQRYAAVWTGDNCSWWEHLAAAVPMLLGLNLSGVPFVGTDVGGFQENASPELYARWIAFSAFTPFFRAHSADDTLPHEPWSFGGKVLDIARHYLRLRYALLPYIYTAFEESARSGEPLMKPLFFEWPEAERLRRVGDSYLFGSALLAAPVTGPDCVVRHLYLPPGGWYDFWDDVYFEGEQDVLAPAPLERLPLFVRAGSIVPREPARLSTSEKRRGPLLLELYPDADGRAEGRLYEDAGEGFGFRDGAFLRLSFVYENGELRHTWEQRGYELPWSGVRVRVHRPARGGYGSAGGAAPGLSGEYSGYGLRRTPGCYGARGFGLSGRDALALGVARLPSAFNDAGTVGVAGASGLEGSAGRQGEAQKQGESLERGVVEEFDYRLY